MKINLNSLKKNNISKNSCFFFFNYFFKNLKKIFFFTIINYAATTKAKNLNVALAKNFDIAIATTEDFNLRYLCQGALSEYPACMCNDIKLELTCINAQFVDTAVFQHLNNYYTHFKSITFHGNNFQDLPENTPLFGIKNNNLPVIYDELVTLNISANYIVNLHSNALQATPNIEILDLSNNEIILNKENILFLTYTPKLTHLYLRRAFTFIINKTLQISLLMEIFYRAKLKHLIFLDLSYNYLNSVPYNLACPFPSLTKLDLQQNLLQNISINTTCLKKINVLNLNRNHFERLDESFQKNFAKNLPDYSIYLKNSYICDCKSINFIQWIKNTNKLKDKTLLICSRASPKNFKGTKIVEIPVKQLDCKVNFEKEYFSSFINCKPNLILIMGLINYSFHKTILKLYLITQ